MSHISVAADAISCPGVVPRGPVTYKPLRTPPLPSSFVHVMLLPDIIAPLETPFVPNSKVFPGFRLIVNAVSVISVIVSVTGVVWSLGRAILKSLS